MQLFLRTKFLCAYSAISRIKTYIYILRTYRLQTYTINLMRKWQWFRWHTLLKRPLCKRSKPLTLPATSESAVVPHKPKRSRRFLHNSLLIVSLFGWESADRWLCLLFAIVAVVAAVSFDSPCWTDVSGVLRWLVWVFVVWPYKVLFVFFFSIGSFVCSCVRWYERRFTDMGIVVYMMRRVYASVLHEQTEYSSAHVRMQWSYSWRRQRTAMMTNDGGHQWQCGRTHIRRVRWQWQWSKANTHCRIDRWRRQSAWNIVNSCG